MNSETATDRREDAHAGRRGVLFSLTASALFGAIFFMPTLLQPLTPEQMYGWRVALALPFMLGLLALVKEWGAIRTIALRLRRQPWLALVLIVNGHLLGLQLWLFAWAPTNGEALSATLGYFLLPLTMVVLGVIVYRERLTGLRLVAVASAVVGIGAAFITADGLSWPIPVIALGYPIYFISRRKFGLDAPGALCFELAAQLPIALFFAMQPTSLGTIGESPMLIPALLFFGLISAVALSSYIIASRLLTLGIFGLLGYVEPLLLVVVSTALLHETIEPNEYVLYGGILLAVILIAIEGVLDQRRATHQFHDITSDVTGEKPGEEPLTGPIHVV
ncbi:EamA family transporter RarD [Ruicaihuangia caeni]|uniref:EamA family transporter RarD n=1 Tax=Ruicaihuangia caeni TaxID=3042517 RepID=UPI00338FAB6F